MSALFLVETTDPDLLQDRADLILDLLRRWLGSFFHGEENVLTEGTDKMKEVRTPGGADPGKKTDSPRALGRPCHRPSRPARPQPVRA